jgi:hypothetical protein
MNVLKYDGKKVRSGGVMLEVGPNPELGESNDPCQALLDAGHFYLEFQIIPLA